MKVLFVTKAREIAPPAPRAPPLALTSFPTARLPLKVMLLTLNGAFAPRSEDMST